MSSVLPALLGAFVLQVHVLVGAAAGKVLMLLSLAACVLAALAAAEPSLSEVGVENQRFSCSASCEQAQDLLPCLPALTARASMLTAPRLWPTVFLGGRCSFRFTAAGLENSGSSSAATTARQQQ
jgi:hypothetical protein